MGCRSRPATFGAKCSTVFEFTSRNARGEKSKSTNYYYYFKEVTKSDFPEQNLLLKGEFGFFILFHWKLCLWVF